MTESLTEWIPEMHTHLKRLREGKYDGVFFRLSLGAREGMKILPRKDKSMKQQGDIPILYHIANNKGSMKLKRHD